MGRRLLFVLGLACAAYGGWIVHHESAINRVCNAEVADPTRGFTISPQCLNIVWPYSEGFSLMLLGAILVFAALMWSRRVMSGEAQYRKDLKAGRYSRANDYMNAYNFNIQLPHKVGAGQRPPPGLPPRE